jgi:acyl-CoA synthetase (AMP-forming)/AMP-acid ligase II
VAVIDVKDARWGERPLAPIVLKPRQTADEVAIQTHLRAMRRAARSPGKRFRIACASWT